MHYRKMEGFNEIIVTIKYIFIVVGAGLGVYFFRGFIQGSFKDGVKKTQIIITIAICVVIALLIRAM